jgi:diaminopimelate epimerase
MQGEICDCDWGKLAQAICRRHFGIGADGLLLLTSSDKADIGMHIYNADGSEAEACGNGLRCLVGYAVNNGLVQSDCITVETIAGIRQARMLEASTCKVQVGMGKPEFKAAKIPVAVNTACGKKEGQMLTDYPLEAAGEKLSLSFMAMGNPHAIYFQDKPVADYPLIQIGPLVENNSLFPNRVNYEVARIIDKNHIDARVWERGVGETLACGSGACATAVAANLLGYVENQVNINMPGGILEINWDGRGEVLLAGLVVTVFSGEWPQ